MVTTSLLLTASLTLGACGSSSSATPTTTAATSNATTSSGGLSLTASASSVIEGEMVQFTASGGSGSYSYANLTGIGTLNPATGLFVAPYSTGTVTIEVTDSNGDTPAEASVTVTTSTGSTGSTGTASTLVVTPSATSIASGGTTSISVSGGTAPYEFILLEGAGSLSTTGWTDSSSTLYTSLTSEVDTVEVEVMDSSYPSQIGYATLSVAAGGTSTSSCSSSTPVPLLSANYSNTKGITSYYSTYGGECVLSASPDAKDTVTCTGMTNMPAMSSYYYTCSGSMKMYDILVNGVDTYGYYAGLPNGECDGNYTSVAVPLSQAITQLQIDARSGEQVVIYGIPTCSN